MKLSVEWGLNAFNIYGVPTMSQLVWMLNSKHIATAL